MKEKKIMPSALIKSIFLTGKSFGINTNDILPFNRLIL